MPLLTELQDSKAVWEAPVAPPLNESLWLAWKQKGRLHDQRSRGRLLVTTKIISIATLLITAALWSQVAPYETGVRFVVTIAAIVLMFRAIGTRHYAAAMMFGLLFLIYNPLVPAFSFSGELQRMLVAVSAVPFAASAFWGKERLVA